MHFSTFTRSALVAATYVSSVLADASITTFPNSLALSASFDPIIAAYWTGLPHHRRTPFAVSPDGKTAWLCFLNADLKSITVQGVSPIDFTAVGTPFTTAGRECAGLVAQDDGFAVMYTAAATGTKDLPTDSNTVIYLSRIQNNAQAWVTALNGPGINAQTGLTATPDANGDLVYSAASGLYAAYFVVTAYTGDAAGHFGDMIQYVDGTGAIKNINGASSTFGCSHNTGIGLEAADEAPFASVCAEDHGAIWLNTETQYMAGVKISNENTTNGVSGEPMGGMSGSYSNLARFGSGSEYIFGWQSRGALDLYTDSWMGAPYTQCSPRWLNHNVAIATLASKSAPQGTQASSKVGAAEGDTQINWITESATDDHQNVHVAAITDTVALVTWETLTSPECLPVPLSCSGTYAGTSFQLVDNTGALIGKPVISKTAFVSGDIANVGAGKVCWPFVDMTWDLSAPASSGALVTKMSFACASTGDDASPPSSSTPPSSLPTSSAAPASAITSSAKSTVLLSTPTSSVIPTPNTLIQITTSALEQPTPTSSVIPTPNTLIQVTTSALGQSTIPTVPISVPTTLATVAKPSTSSTTSSQAAVPSTQPEDDTCEAEL